MVFRGKPSKSCERCRLRRLKASDLTKGPGAPAYILYSAVFNDQRAGHALEQE